MRRREITALRRRRKIRNKGLALARVREHGFHSEQDFAYRVSNILLDPRIE
jgi:hypothetical protein